jgi:hypothetical protein
MLFFAVMNEHMVNRSPARLSGHLTPLVFVILGLAACSRPTDATSTWHEQAASGRPYGKILVVGITENSNNRRRFENAMTSALEGRGSTAWASHTKMPGEEPVNRETVGKVVESTGADAVLVTRLVSHEVTGQDIDARTGVATNPESERHYNLNRYDYGEYSQGASLVARNTVTLSTEIYETSRGELVYSVNTTTYDKESAFEILDEATLTIAKRLGQDRLIR